MYASYCITDMNRIHKTSLIQNRDFTPGLHLNCVNRNRFRAKYEIQLYTCRCNTSTSLCRPILLVYIFKWKKVKVINCSLSLILHNFFRVLCNKNYIISSKHRKSTHPIGILLFITHGAPINTNF